MRWYSFVLLPTDTEDLGAAIDRSLASFHADVPVPPYRRPADFYEYQDLFEACAPHLIAEKPTHYETWQALFAALPEAEKRRLVAEAKVRLRGKDAGFDDAGLYVVSTQRDPFELDGWGFPDRGDTCIVFEDTEERKALVSRLCRDYRRLHGAWGLRELASWMTVTDTQAEAILSKHIEFVAALHRSMCRGRYRRTVPAAIVTPRPVFGEGEQQRWHAKSGYGSSYENDSSRDWMETVYELYELFNDHFAVCIECHR